MDMFFFHLITLYYNVIIFYFDGDSNMLKININILIIFNYEFFVLQSL